MKNCPFSLLHCPLFFTGQAGRRHNAIYPKNNIRAFENKVGMNFSTPNPSRYLPARSIEHVVHISTFKARIYFIKLTNKAATASL